MASLAWQLHWPRQFLGTHWEYSRLKTDQHLETRLQLSILWVRSITEANNFILYETRLHMKGAHIFIMFRKLFLLRSHSSIKSNHHKPKYRKYLEAFQWYRRDFKNGKWLAAAFVLRDLFLPVSTCYRQTNKTDALGMGSLWVHYGIQLPVLRNSDKLQCAWLHQPVSAIPKETRKQNIHFSFL